MTVPLCHADAVSDRPFAGSRLIAPELLVGIGADTVVRA